MNRNSLFNTTFFNFVFGFIFILSTSLVLILAVNYYDVTFSELKQAAATLLFMQ